jgi:peptidyl-prolyl cis-trans isomerase A (cyclophilin A)
MFRLLAACLILAGCQKNKPVETVPPEVLDPSLKKKDDLDTSTRAAVETSRKTGLQPFPDAVQPPQASDLPRYISDLKGAGALLAIIETTMGQIRCELFEDKTPITVANFVGLARGLKPYRNPKSGEQTTRPYYDGLTFHRVIPRFMIQGGDPLGTGTGGPGYKFGLEIHPLARHDGPGALAMANAGPDTNGSQFFITEEAKPELNDKYTVFGRCKNIAVVRDIARVESDAKNRPNKPVAIKRLTIIRGNL